MGEPHDTPTSFHSIDSSITDEIYGLPTNSGRSLGELIAPDDWRLYHLMRELTNDDRLRILSFAEMLFSLREARKWADARVDTAVATSASAANS